ncbi:carbon monoxide dehydrogenase [Nocardioides mangrovicus]|uniref:Carbon monoxide dehydrogenase n=1 Tax=Nocardioides mangrovicus TaxID=2478913 RepID=A0A3L8P7W3_9ACTN|nr:carbon monoxide dehydrogenase subunit G [Nocardioides mangrovicus]RLV50873.1 carbon monoxide dehydrogenase [Nocardioides mangrovicus]
MRITGENTIAAPVQQVWDALLDPRVLVRTIPGCSRLEETAEHAYAMTVTAGVAAIKGTYDGTCALSDLHEPSSLTMRLDGSGAPGTVGATVEVSFGDNGDGTTLLHYDADAVVGGMVGGVGQRMLTSVSKRMAAEFFTQVERAITDPSQVEEVAPATVSEPKGDRVFTPPSRPPGSLNERSFLTGIAVGAGLVLLGVVAGRITRRV